MKQYMYRTKIQYLLRRCVKVAPALLNRIIKRGVFAFDLCSSYWKRESYVYADADFVRNSTLEMCAREIHSRNIQGAVAELGVFRGDYAKLINRAFPDRKLYLFDSFEGFHPTDVDVDKEMGNKRKMDQFSDTSERIVLKKMKYPQNCIVKKGFFPDSYQNVSEKFAFVSIDFDLYKPIYDGLCIMWDNMETGGFIFVHDYNNIAYPGSKKAVLQFCAERKAPFVPLSDTCGSAIIIKI